MNKNPMSVGRVVNFLLNESDMRKRKNKKKDFECKIRRNISGKVDNKDFE